MNTKESIAKAYDRAARDYAAAMWNELEGKPFDQIILRWFATQIPPEETVLEVGCGPGEVSGFLHRQGVKCLGTDISMQMIEAAREYFPEVQFEVQDFFRLGYDDDTFCGVVGFYAIVNLALEEVRAMLVEVKRVLKPAGLFLFSFHVDQGEAKIDVENFFNHEGNALTFYCFNVDDVKALVESAGFQVVDILIRYPYKDVEYPSKRAYFVVRKP
jgi:ubiquinone/menaquinone biosynthesis C-methylase UbiE